MEFSRTEMIAILSMANAMVVADGKVDENEITVISLESLKFGITPDDFKTLYKKGMEMDPEIAIGIVSKMNKGQKEYVSAFLGTIMAIDKDIDDKELALWKLLSTLCNLPSMTITDAINYMAEK